MNGWVKLHRQILDNEFLQNDVTSYIVFTKLLLYVDKKTGSRTSGRYVLESLTGLKGSTIYKSLKRLEKAGMVTQVSNNKYTTISICNWSHYQGAGNSSGKNEVKTREKQGNTKQEVRIENIVSKDTMAKAEINEMFDYWLEVTGLPITARIKQNRYACNNLIKKHGVDGVKRLVGGVAQAQGDKYAPRISDFSQLQSKLGDLLLWGKKKTKERGTVKI